MRFRLQKKEAIARPNILGNHSFPVHTYRWRDIAMSESIDELLKIMPDNKDYRIEDTRRVGESDDRK